MNKHDTNETLGYSAWAEAYDGLVAGSQFYTNLRVQEAALLQRTVGARSSGRALDIGCGTGDFAIALARFGFATMGVDISSAMLEVAMDKARIAEVEVEFVKKDALEIADIDGSFDVITAFGSVMNHVEDWNELLDSVAAKLAPGGVFVFSCDNLMGVDSWTWALFKGILGRDGTAVADWRRRMRAWRGGGLHKNEWTFLTPAANSAVHLFYYSIGRIERMLRARGLAVGDRIGANILSTVQPSVLFSCYDLRADQHRWQRMVSRAIFAVDRVIGRVLWRLGANLVYVVRKPTS